MMVKKYLALGLAGILAVMVISGCNQEPIYFEGKLMEVQKVQEILSDRLEDENGIEFNVKISEDLED